jgi:hypothetical protein
MAKQTFTTGQVLLASQLTSLQQTAMLGGAASAKTASYTLVAADAGSAISMTSTSATSVTVNSGLFAAGDTVQITNLGSGVSTITAGTATVNTSASLALAQYESGTLDFTSASAAIFIKGAGAVAVSGANFAEVNSGGTNLTGASTITISGITNANFLQVIVHQASSANASSDITMKINADGGSNYYRIGNLINEDATTINAAGSLTNDSLFLATLGASALDYVSASATIIGGNSAGRKVVNVNGSVGAGYGSSKGCWYQGQWIGSATISSISIISSTGNFDGGKVYVYASA